MSSRPLRAPLAAALLPGVLAVPAIPAPATAMPAAVAHVVSDAEGARSAATVFARMTEAQRIGQLFMVATPAASVDPATRTQVRRFHVGNVMLAGRSFGGTRPPARVAAELQARATGPASPRCRAACSRGASGRHGCARTPPRGPASCAGPA
jgi:beta-N-acetylhexosaminidase